MKKKVRVTGLNSFVLIFLYFHKHKVYPRICISSLINVEYRLTEHEGMSRRALSLTHLCIIGCIQTKIPDIVMSEQRRYLVLMYLSDGNILSNHPIVKLVISRTKCVN